MPWERDPRWVAVDPDQSKMLSGYRTLDLGGIFDLLRKDELSCHLDGRQMDPS